MFSHIQLIFITLIGLCSAISISSLNLYDGSLSSGFFPTVNLAAFITSFQLPIILKSLVFMFNSFLDNAVCSGHGTLYGVLPTETAIYFYRADNETAILFRCHRRVTLFTHAVLRSTILPGIRSSQRNIAQYLRSLFLFNSARLIVK